MGLPCLFAVGRHSRFMYQPGRTRLDPAPLVAAPVPLVHQQVRQPSAWSGPPARGHRQARGMGMGGWALTPLDQHRAPPAFCYSRTGTCLCAVGANPPYPSAPSALATKNTSLVRFRAAGQLAHVRCASVRRAAVRHRCRLAPHPQFRVPSRVGDPDLSPNEAIPVHGAHTVAHPGAHRALLLRPGRCPRR